MRLRTPPERLWSRRGTARGTPRRSSTRPHRSASHWAQTATQWHARRGGVANWHHGAVPKVPKGERVLDFRQAGHLGERLSRAMAPSGQLLPIELFLRLWCRAARMVKHGERHQELIQGSITIRSQKASAHSTEVRLGILANASASAMVPSGPPLPMLLLVRLCDVQEWAVVRSMPRLSRENSAGAQPQRASTSRRLGVGLTPEIGARC